MKLWLLRHGEAEPRAQDHPERALTPKGWQEARDSAQMLKGQPLDLILVSPYQRAQETAQAVCEVIGYQGPQETVDWALPESPVRPAIQALDAYPQAHILLVTHQNFVGALGGLLVEGHMSHPLPMHTGSLALLEGAAAAAGLMHLLSLRHPFTPSL